MVILGMAPLVAFLVDRSRHQGRVARNVVLDGIAIGGMPLPDLESTLTATASQYASRPVVLLFDDLEIRSTAGEYGFALDVSATVAAVESVGSADGIWVQLVDWFGRIRESTAVESVFSNDVARARSTLEHDAVGLRSEPREPSITFDGAALELDPGNAGREVDVARTMQAIGTLASLEPIVGSWSPIPTRVSRADSIGLFTSLSRHTGSGLILFHEAREEFISPKTYAGWLSAVTVDGKLQVDFAETDIYRTIEEAFFGYASGDLVVTYDLVDGSPRVVGISDTRTVCCATGVVELVKSVALGETDGPIGLPLRRPTEDEQAASVASLGVTEPIASFTTFHRCCEGRVTNIHRIADLTRGVVIWPGESFSVNDFVGKRTRANGFVEGGVIYQGQFDSDVGGGVSQYATTLFNAAFFGGLELTTYQSHSLYLDRYPYGREATLSFPAPDLVISNPTPYAVLIWPTYDRTSLTVTLYSTTTSVVVEAGQSVDTWRSCTRVTTYRIREYTDGTKIEDAVYALYRPSAGYTCDGLPEPGTDGGS